MSYADFETIRTEAVENRILIVSLNSPDSVNSVSRKMIEEHLKLRGNLVHDMTIRVIVLKGEGENVSAADIFKPENLKVPIMYDCRFNFGELKR